MSLLFRAKPSCIFLTFILTNSIMVSQIEEKCQISLLLNHSAKTVQSPTTEQPWHLSAKPQGFLDFFLNRAPLPSTFPLGVQFSWQLSASPLPSIFCLGGTFSVSFNRVPLIVWTVSGYALDVSPSPPPPPPASIFPTRRGLGNLLHSQIKLRISTNTGDSRTERDLPKFVCTP